ncbi:polysaccharide deacetylase family protein [Streptomyces poriferorum]|uniref:Polysaccharide deacetylase family protein n=2 Tax=Streptomyces poriferorum TaxID=2798799 RepID=A0ABY9ITA4_9ACTN|nr:MULTISPECIES: polysaccharide deacetylase family protein [Streptomyces]MDP5314141.1 polysaccharide deacetylase family protein [Streptomyces sp. Alt4]WLQ56926.1 polysaccharide deacetylase family protein [Streptomyces sp. Alt2]
MKRRRPGTESCGQGWTRRGRGHLRRGPGYAVLAALLVAAAGSGCAAETGGSAPADPVRVAAARAGQPGGPPAAGAAGSVAAQAEKARRAQAARAVAAKKWGLAGTPLAPPAPPAVKPHLTTRKGFEVEGGDASLPPVFTTVPTDKKIVFLTMDDGDDKDPELLKMMSELNIPYSAFLSDYLVRDDYAYFKEAQVRGVVLGNHTLNHRYLPGLSHDEQTREICDQQDIIEQQYGERPRLFRPPYGNYNGDTLRIAKSCGITAVPLWAAEAFPDRMEWREEDQDLHPGDIILTHFRGKKDWKGSMPDMIRNVMKVITDKGYAVARLEDYV